MTLTFDQIRAYFEARHPGQKIGTRAKVSVKCIFHDDRTPSYTLFLDGAGGFHCNGCGAGGNVFQFEARFSGCTLAEAEAKVAEITGAKPAFGSFAKLGPVVAAYDYRDDDERVLFQKRRYQPEGEQKTFRVYRPGEQGNWIAGIDPPDGAPTKRVLYNQPRVVTANVIAVSEGEKDADNVAQCGLWAERTKLRLATTCNFDGAWRPGEKSKWLPAYNVYFAEKFVIVFADNDENGEAWAQAVAQNVHPYAHTVKIIRLPGLLAKGDVSDWLVPHRERARGGDKQGAEVETDRRLPCLSHVPGRCSVCSRSRSYGRLAGRGRYPSRRKRNRRRPPQSGEEFQFARPGDGGKLRRSMDGYPSPEAYQDGHRQPRR